MDSEGLKRFSFGGVGADWVDSGGLDRFSEGGWSGLGGFGKVGAVFWKGLGRFPWGIWSSLSGFGTVGVIFSGEFHGGLEQFSVDLMRFFLLYLGPVL